MNKLTVIIPYNKDRGFLSKAIESVQSQTVEVDLILSHSPDTCAVNLANGLEQVKTKFYAILAEDDWLDHRFAEKMLKGIRESDLIYCNAFQYKGYNRSVYRATYNDLAGLIRTNTIHGGAVVYRTDSVRFVGGYDTELTTAEEYDLHLRMSKEGCKFASLNPNFELYNYNLHSDNKSRLDKIRIAERRSYIDKQIKQKYR
jgi:GT2 family glycosyltransferase